MNAGNKTLWELLWDYDPNALIVVDTQLEIKIVNPAFCTMFKRKADELIGQPAKDVLGDMDDFERVWNEDKTLLIEEKRFADVGLSARQVIFAIRDQGVIASILVDITTAAARRDEMTKIKRNTLDQIQEVVDRQMKVAQEIASLLGETTAETKTSLLRLIDTVEQEL